MSNFTSLSDAIATHVASGRRCVWRGSHLIPSRLGMKSSVKEHGFDVDPNDPDLIYDRLIEWAVLEGDLLVGRNPGGSLHRFRDAVENGWPHAIGVVRRQSCCGSCGLCSGRGRLAYGVLRIHGIGSANPSIRFLECPFTGERLAATPAINPDVTIIHAQKPVERERFTWALSVYKEAAPLLDAVS